MPWAAKFTKDEVETLIWIGLKAKKKAKTPLGLSDNSRDDKWNCTSLIAYHISITS
jgi:hypothetical protein